MITAGLAEPQDECGEAESGPIADGEFVETSRYRPELLEPIEAALDHVPGLVLLVVEGGRPAAGGSAARSVRFLVSPFRDDRSVPPMP
ncbi:hypothetical protein ABB07_38205 [Streptomyces incarnatus]|uniref:Glycoside hydrolase family 3 C-terminal domain-containing protein n=1 Tax=Streptomyces incarnatus TaxID=665007 RepID=A0ABN4GR09_9ACTN|nr:hypothetical protein ABB07_38205 [Streptomyces incarnatus]